LTAIGTSGGAGGFDASAIGTAFLGSTGRDIAIGIGSATRGALGLGGAASSIVTSGVSTTRRDRTIGVALTGRGTGIGRLDTSAIFTKRFASTIGGLAFAAFCTACRTSSCGFGTSALYTAISCATISHAAISIRLTGGGAWRAYGFLASSFVAICARSASKALTIAIFLAGSRTDIRLWIALCGASVFRGRFNRHFGGGLCRRLNSGLCRSFNVHLGGGFGGIALAAAIWTALAGAEDTGLRRCTIGVLGTGRCGGAAITTARINRCCEQEAKDKRERP
jgi:hypothetical protein